MGKKTANEVLDAALQYTIDNVDTYIACAGEPADYAAATTLVSSGGNKLGDTPLAAADFGAIADGDVSGRKVAIPERSVTFDEADTVDHIALVDDTNSVLLHVTEVADPFDSVAGESETFASYDEEIEDPT